MASTVRFPVVVSKYTWDPNGPFPMIGVLFSNLILKLEKYLSDVDWTPKILFGLYWLSIPEEESAQPIITLKYRCELIVKNSHEFPKNVIDNCKKLLKEENEIEWSKSSIGS